MGALSLLLIATSLYATRARGATTYYISPAGDDASAGTSPAAPWRSAARASQIVFAPGDAVLFLGGATHNLAEGGAGLTVRTATGSAAPPVLVSSYGGGAPPLLLADATKFDAVTILNTGGVEVANLTVVNPASTDLNAVSFAGIHALSTGTDDAAPRFSAIFIHDVSASGFHFGVAVDAFSSCQGFTDVTILRVSATNSTNTGISSQGSYSAGCYSHARIIVAHSSASYNAGNAAHTAAWSGSGIVLSGVDGALISRSVAHHNGAANGHLGGGPCGIWGWMANNLTISHCVSHENSNGQPPFTSNDGCGYDLDGGCTNSVVEYSLSFWNSGPGVLVCDFGAPIVTANNTVRYSVSYQDGLASNNGASGLNWWTPSELRGTLALGNTFIGGTPATAAASGSAAAPISLVQPFEGGDVSSGAAWERRGMPIPAAAAAAAAAASGNSTASYSDVSLLRNALLSVGAGAGAAVDFAQAPSGATTTLRGNQYWAAAPAPPLRIAWGGADYGSLAAFRAGSGQETAADGSPTGSDADPGLAAATGFFQGCVDWQPGYPALPNSPDLDALRGFAGC